MKDKPIVRWSAMLVISFTMCCVIYTVSDLIVFIVALMIKVLS